jgi:hypothetical protein
VGYFVGAMIIIGHWIDVYQMVMPGALNLPVVPSNEYPAGHIEVEFQGIGGMEIGFLCLFGGLFLFLTHKALAKANLYPTKHPYIMESALHDVGV